MLLPDPTALHFPRVASPGRRDQNNSRKGKTLTYRAKSLIIGYGLLFPAVLALSVFYLFPLLKVFWMSFHRWPLFGAATWVGLDNFKAVLSTPDFWKAIRFTFLYTFTVTPMLLLLGFVSALLCNVRMPGTTVLRSLLFLPVVISFATASFVWLWMYSELYGVLTMGLRWLSGDEDQQLNLFSKASHAMWAVNVMVTWKFAGISMIILLAGMQNIRDDFYEAGRLMGASRLYMIWSITLPLLRPTIALATILCIAGSIQAYEQFAIMTGGGPSNQTRTIMMLTVDTAFDYFKLGPASAMSVCLMAIVLAITLLQLRILGRRQRDGA